MSSRGVTSTENDFFHCLPRLPNFLIDPEDEGKHWFLSCYELVGLFCINIWPDIVTIVRRIFKSYDVRINILSKKHGLQITFVSDTIF